MITQFAILEKYKRFWMDLDQDVLFGSGFCQSLRQIQERWSATVEGSVGLRTLNDKKVYRHLLEQREAGKIVCPLSLTHYMELSATSSYRQRTDVATVMAALSGFRTIASASVLRHAEIEQALSERFGKPEAPAQPQPFGSGVFYAASGRHQMAKIEGDDASMKALVAAMGGIEKVKELEHELTIQAEFEMLRGPHDSMVQELRDTYGYAPEEAEKIARQRAAREGELAQQLIADPSLKKKCDNIVTASFIIWELRDALLLALTKVGMTIEDMFAQGAESVTQFIHAIPTAGYSPTNR